MYWYLDYAGHGFDALILFVASWGLGYTYARRNDNRGADR
jgi:hypothetical protein